MMIIQVMIDDDFTQIFQWKVCVTMSLWIDMSGAHNLGQHFWTRKKIVMKAELMVPVWRDASEEMWNNVMWPGYLAGP